LSLSVRFWNFSLMKKTLEKTEGAIKNEQYIETGNTVHTRHRTKTNKEQKHTTEQ